MFLYVFVVLWFQGLLWFTIPIDPDASFGRPASHHTPVIPLKGKTHAGWWSQSLWKIMEFVKLGWHSNPMTDPCIMVYILTSRGISWWDPWSTINIAAPAGSVIWELNGSSHKNPLPSRGSPRGKSQVLHLESAYISNSKTLQWRFSSALGTKRQRVLEIFVGKPKGMSLGSNRKTWVCLKMLCTPKNPMVNDDYPY